MAVPSAPTVYIGSGHKPDVEAYAQVETLTSDAVTSVTVIISQTQGGAAIETVTSDRKSASYPRYETWYVHYHTTGITSSPYYITAYGTNADGDGTPTVVSTYIFFPPSVSITFPTDGATLTRSAVTMEWNATDSTGISYQRVSVSKDGTELWGAEVDGSSIAIPQSVAFNSGESYTFSVTARNGKGMETTATSTASFLFETPTAAVLGISEGDSKSAVIEVTGFTPKDSPSQPNPEYVDIARINSDGSSWLIASDLSVGDTCIDPLPPLGVETVYKAIGRVVDAGVSEQVYLHEIPSKGWVFNFGDSAQEHIELLYNPEATFALEQGGASYHFADGGVGGGLPVFYPTTDRDMSGTLKFDTVMYGDADAVVGMCDRYPVVWMRDPFGHRWMAKVKPSVVHGLGGKRTVTLSWNAVRFKEVLRG